MKQVRAHQLTSFYAKPADSKVQTSERALQYLKRTDWALMATTNQLYAGAKKLADVAIAAIARARAN